MPRAQAEIPRLPEIGHADAAGEQFGFEQASARDLDLQPAVVEAQGGVDLLQTRPARNHGLAGGAHHRAGCNPVIPRQWSRRLIVEDAVAQAQFEQKAAFVGVERKVLGLAAEQDVAGFEMSGDDGPRQPCLQLVIHDPDRQVARQDLGMVFARTPDQMRVQVDEGAGAGRMRAQAEAAETAEISSVGLKRLGP